MANTPNWQKNSGKNKKTRGISKGVIKARKQSLKSLNEATEVAYRCSEATTEEREKDYTLEWAYGVGYSRSSMKDVARRLEDIVVSLSEVSEV